MHLFDLEPKEFVSSKVQKHPPGEPSRGAAQEPWPQVRKNEPSFVGEIQLLHTFLPAERKVHCVTVHMISLGEFVSCCSLLTACVLSHTPKQRPFHPFQPSSQDGCAHCSTPLGEFQSSFQGKKCRAIVLGKRCALHWCSWKDKHIFLLGFHS